MNDFQARNWRGLGYAEAMIDINDWIGANIKDRDPATMLALTEFVGKLITQNKIETAKVTP